MSVGFRILDVGGVIIFRVLELMATSAQSAYKIDLGHATTHSGSIHPHGPEREHNYEPPSPSLVANHKLSKLVCLIPTFPNFISLSPGRIEHNIK